jgi:hypothetical protein
METASKCRAVTFDLPSKARGVVKKNRSKYEYYCSNVRPGSANWWHQRTGRVAV